MRSRHHARKRSASFWISRDKRRSRARACEFRGFPRRGLGEAIAAIRTWDASAEPVYCAMGRTVRSRPPAFAAMTALTEPSASLVYSVSACAGETEWAGERTLARSRNGEAARWSARRALGAARAAPPRGARREKSRGRRTIVVSRSNPGRSSRLRRTFDEEWLAESDALVLSISIVGGVSLELEIDFAPRPECFGESSTVFFRALATFGAPAPPAMRQCAAEEIQHNTQSGLRSASIVTTNSTSRGDLPRRADVLEHGGEPDSPVRPQRYP